MNAEKTKVIFRKFRNGDVIALFPQIAGSCADYGCSMQSYMHIGQHGAADCVTITKPAIPEEYADLKSELEGIGYELKIVKRATYQDYLDRRKQTM